MMGQAFFRVPARAIGLKLTAADWSVLAVICLHADPAGRAFPSQGRIADLARVTRRHVPRSINRLIEVGLLAATRVKNDNGAWDNTVYQITFRPAEVSPEKSLGVPSDVTLTESLYQEEDSLGKRGSRGKGANTRSGGVPSDVTTPSAWGASAADRDADFVFDDDLTDDAGSGRANGAADVQGIAASIVRAVS